MKAMLLSVSLLASFAQASTIRFHCFEECTLSLAGKKGAQDRPRRWDFEGVPAGHHALEVTGADGKKSTASIDVKDGQEVYFAVDGKGRALEMLATPLTAKGSAVETTVLAASADGGAPVEATSTLRVVCQRPCTIYVGGLRQKNTDAKTAVITGVKPGSVQVYGKDTLNNVLGGGVIEVPAGSEVFVRADGDKTTVTAVKALTR